MRRRATAAAAVGPGAAAASELFEESRSDPTRSSANGPDHPSPADLGGAAAAAAAPAAGDCCSAASLTRSGSQPAAAVPGLGQGA